MLLVTLVYNCTAASGVCCVGVAWVFSIMLYGCGVGVQYYAMWGWRGCSVVCCGCTVLCECVLGYSIYLCIPPLCYQDLKSSTANRQESYSLLKDELSSIKSKPQTRENMFKTFQAIAVLQARRVLASLLEKWPKEGARLSTTTLGCVDMPQYFCLLDLLVKQEGKEVRTCHERGDGLLI